MKRKPRHALIRILVVAVVALVIITAGLRYLVGDGDIFGAIRGEDYWRVFAICVVHPDQVRARGLGMETPLHAACRAREGRTSISTMRLLLRFGADPNASDGNGPAMRIAAREDNRAAVRLLISKGADVNATDRDGRTALHTAALWFREEMVVDLIENGADPNAKDTAGATPLLLAACTRMMEWHVTPRPGDAQETIDLLIEHGAEVDLFVASALGDVKRATRLQTAGRRSTLPANKNRSRSRNSCS